MTLCSSSGLDPYMTCLACKPRCICAVHGPITTCMRSLSLKVLSPAIRSSRRHAGSHVHVESLVRCDSCSIANVKCIEVLTVMTQISPAQIAIFDRTYVSGISAQTVSILRVSSSLQLRRQVLTSETALEQSDGAPVELSRQSEKHALSCVHGQHAATNRLQHTTSIEPRPQRPLHRAPKPQAQHRCHRQPGWANTRGARLLAPGSMP